MVQQTLVGQGLTANETSRSDSDTPHSVGLLWTGDQPDAETSTRKHTILTTDIQTPPPRGIRTRNPSKPAAARLRPRAHWYRHKLSIMRPKFSYQTVKKLVVCMGESNGKLSPRTCPGCSVPEPYRSHDWALVPAKPGLQG